MKKWLKRIGIGLLVIVFLFFAVTYLRFSQWRSEVTKNLARDSTVVQTAKGPIEYAQIGQGPPVLMIHGDPGGYDQIYQALNATVPDASRDAGHQNDIAEQANISELPLKSIRCSTLILQGTADVNVPIAHGEFAHVQIAGSQFMRLQGEDHWMVITKHRELGKLIHAFLVEHAGRG
jgi:hypothetical protein